MKHLVGPRLPKFTEEQTKLVNGSFDFIGLNYYTTNYVESLPVLNQMNKSYSTDGCTRQTGNLALTFTSITSSTILIFN